MNTFSSALHIYRKAFDGVWHEALVAKLVAIGVGSDLSRWITSFLSDRSIRVVLDGSVSEKHSITIAGVPQSSVPLPYLHQRYVFVDGESYLLICRRQHHFSFIFILQTSKRSRD